MYRFNQWARRMSGDHDELHGSQKQIDAEPVRQLTEAEIVEGLGL